MHAYLHEPTLTSSFNIDAVWYSQEFENIKHDDWAYSYLEVKYLSHVGTYVPTFPGAIKV